MWFYLFTIKSISDLLPALEGRGFPQDGSQVCGLPPSSSQLHSQWLRATPLRSSNGRLRAGSSAHYPYPSPRFALSSWILGTRGYIFGFPIWGHVSYFNNLNYSKFKNFTPPLEGAGLPLFVIENIPSNLLYQSIYIRLLLQALMCTLSMFIALNTKGKHNKLMN